MGGELVPFSSGALTAAGSGDPVSEREELISEFNVGWVARFGKVGDESPLPLVPGA